MEQTKLDAIKKEFKQAMPKPPEELDTFKYDTTDARPVLY